MLNYFNIFLFLTLLVFFNLNNKPTIATYNPADRTWVASANFRIDKYRKALLTVKLVDASGQPLTNQMVEIHQVRHAFSFGSAVSTKYLLAKDSQQYRKIVKKNFNEVVFENDLKWENWNSNSGASIDKTLLALQWCKHNDLKIRGHYLVWAPVRSIDYYGSAISLTQLNNATFFKELILKHINDILYKTDGLVNEWDAINHIITRNQKGQLERNNSKILLNDYINEDIYSEIIKTAYNFNPNLKCYVNEGDLLTTKSNTNKINDYYKAIVTLKEKKVPIGGIGFMSHFPSKNLPSIYYLLSTFERFSKFNLPLKVTEFDVQFGKKGEFYSQSEDELKLQKQFTEDYMRLCFSIPAFTGFVIWGFWEGRHWYPAAALYNKNWNIKPNGTAWQRLVFKEWWTNTKIRTDAKGVCLTRAFLGDYIIKYINANNDVITKKVTLTSSGLNLTLQ